MEVKGEEREIAIDEILYSRKNIEYTFALKILFRGRKTDTHIGD